MKNAKSLKRVCTHTGGLNKIKEKNNKIKIAK